MTSVTKLKLIKTTHRVVDIYASWKADVAARDWEQCHINGDRSAPVDLPDSPRRGWMR